MSVMSVTKTLSRWLPRPDQVMIEFAVTQLGARWSRLVQDERGLDGTTESLIKVAIVVAAVGYIIGKIIVPALVRLATKTAGDIDSAGSWSP